MESGENTNQGGTLDNDATSFHVGDDVKDRQYRGILAFDTTSLPNNAVILQAQLKVRQQGIVGSDPFGTHGTLLSEIRNGTFSNNAILQTGDYSSAATPGYVWDTFAEQTPDWYVTELHNANLLLVNKAGTTQFRLFFSKADNDDLNADYVNFYSGDAQISNTPQLVVTYYVP